MVYTIYLWWVGGLLLYYQHYMAINAMIYLAYILVYLFSNVSKAIDGLYTFMAN